MEVYEPGTNVLLTDEVPATIVSVAIHSGNYIQYECVWWSGQSRNREWFSEAEILEFVDKDKPKIQIGFCRIEASE
jgi:uncharacterized protein YodC (DUF2158 family)